MTRVHKIVEHELTFGAFILAFWIGATIFTMTSHLFIQAME